MCSDFTLDQASAVVHPRIVASQLSPAVRRKSNASAECCVSSKRAAGLHLQEQARCGSIMRSLVNKRCGNTGCSGPKSTPCGCCRSLNNVRPSPRCRPPREPYGPKRNPRSSSWRGGERRKNIGRMRFQPGSKPSSRSRSSRKICQSWRVSSSGSKSAGEKLGRIAHGKIVENQIVVLGFQTGCRRQNNVSVARRLVDVNVYGHHEIKRRQGAVELGAVRCREHRITRVRDQGLI